MEDHKQKNWFERIGCAVSGWVADKIAHPFAQIGVIAFCALWWIVKLPTDILTAGLSIMAITLTQMVLNNQAEREADVHRRDVAMHAKLDALVAASKRAKNELVAVEELEEEEIEQIKDEVKQAIDEAGDEAGDPEERDVAKRAAEREIEKEVGKVKASKSRPRRAANNGNGGSKRASSSGR